MNEIANIIILFLFHVAFLIIFYYLYILESKKYIKLWALSWLSFMLSSFFVLINIGDSFTFFTVLFERFFSLLGVYYLSKGSFLFFCNKKSNLVDITFYTFASLLILTHLTNLYTSSPNIFNTIYLIGSFVYIGFLSLRHVYIKSKIRYFVGFNFIFWGLVSIIFLFTEYIGLEVLALIYSLMGVFAITSSVGLLFAYFLHTREYRNSLDIKMRYINMYDSLTNVYNRNYCELLLDQYEDELVPPVSILFGDLNNLKLINDIFGHHVGDEMLKHTAEVINKVTQDISKSIVARWGGDEFIIILPNTDYTKASEVVNAIENMAEIYESKIVPMYISLGAATKTHANQTLQNTLQLADSSLYLNKFKKSSLAKKSIVDYFVNVLFDNEIESIHARRVERLALIIAEALNLSEKEQQELSLISALHDIGKCSIPLEILNKEEELTHEEWLIMKRHPEIGYRILQTTSEYVNIAHSVLSHHEFWNGNGYPQNLKGENIPLFARIIAIAEAYEEMTQSKIYKVKLSKEEALKEIESNAGSQFDPYIARVFIDAMKKEDYQ